MYTQRDEVLWKTSDNIVVLEKIERAILSREEYKNKVSNGPNFSLGMTPEHGNDIWVNVNNITRNYIMEDTHTERGHKDEEP